MYSCPGVWDISFLILSGLKQQLPQERESSACYLCVYNILPNSSYFILQFEKL